METTWRQTFLKLYETYCESDQDNEQNYFQMFDKALEQPYARQHYEQLEGELGQLDNEAWQEFKQKVHQCAIVKDNKRGWRELFDYFNEVKGYLYLKSLGCREIHFILEETMKTPDLYGLCGTDGILMEVKTINRSDDELDWIKMNLELLNRKGNLQEGIVRNGLDDLLRRKIMDTINRAKQQLENYADNRVQRKIVYLVIDLDILSGRYNKRNHDELMAFIKEQNNEQIEVICHQGNRFG